MRTTQRVTALVAAALVAGGAALSLSGAAAAAHDHDQILRLHATTAQDSFVDIGAPGPSLGDQIVSSDTIFRDGKAVGRDGSIATVVGARPGVLTMNTVLTVQLPEGQLVLTGLGDGPAGPPTQDLTFTLAVAGGTGRYERAHGTATVLDRPGGIEDITIRLA